MPFSDVSRRLLSPFINRLDNHIRQVVLHQHLIFGEPTRVRIDPTAKVANVLFNVYSGTITVGPEAFLAHSVMLLTGSHDYTKLGRERQDSMPTEGRDIVIERGAWVASNATVLGPCVIGEHAVVASGSVVTSDVAPLTVVAGVPAKVLRRITPSSPS
jgi:acetyltransferase-like isoleucine patch superfamily enzyme